VNEADRVTRLSCPGLDSRVSILRLGTEVDAMFVLTERFGVLVDTLSTPDACRQALELVADDLGGRRLLVVNSHMDWDHFWGNSALPEGTCIFAHVAARDRLPKSQDELWRKAADEPRFAGITLVPPNLTFATDLHLDGGDLVLELMHTPGHTPDHLCVWIPAMRTCLAMDCVEYPVPEVWSDHPADLAALRRSLVRIRNLHADIVLPAHGGTFSPDIVDQNIAYFDLLVDRADALARTSSDADLSTSSGLQLEDLLPNAGEMSPLYRGFHAANLRAAIRMHNE
jgi:glyoxylase-like metal-dependent hydrolase (beta-lactamase superfamily II)